MRIADFKNRVPLVAVLALIASVIVLAAEARGAEPVATAEAVPSTEATPKLPITVSPLSATVSLTNGTNLAGALVSSTELKMKSSFGEVSIPLSEVAGIKMASDGNATTTVVLHNGDSVTGATQLDIMELQTEWGKAEINCPSIVSILFAQDLQWASDEGVAGTRWRLTKTAKPEAANAATANAATANAAAASPARQPNSRLQYYYGR